ncbi:MAG: hypothetical protein D6690_13355 [Nitrospirae bacterium]|nr:MAG: hypothetical protein D6690_13355 [Nitrospirota bacterium]
MIVRQWIKGFAMASMMLIEQRCYGVMTEQRWTVKGKSSRACVFANSFHTSQKLHKLKGVAGGTIQCAECGEPVKVLVSPKRNPHSGKLGRPVPMKDHDLCRRCWRRLFQRKCA